MNNYVDIELNDGAWVQVFYSYTPEQKASRNEYGWEPHLDEVFEVEAVLYKNVDIKPVFDEDTLDDIRDMAYDKLKGANDE